MSLHYRNYRRNRDVVARRGIYRHERWPTDWPDEMHCETRTAPQAFEDVRKLAAELAGEESE